MEGVGFSIGLLEFTVIDKPGKKIGLISETRVKYKFIA